MIQTSALSISLSLPVNSGSELQSVISCLTVQLNTACPLLSLSSVISSIIVASQRDPSPLNCLLAGFKIDNLLLLIILVVLIM